jgi:predicted SAM-dependent methyltransferase
MVKLHIGCGKKIKEGYDNIDYYEGPIKMDAGNLEYPDNSVDEILTHHTLEHIEHFKTENVVREWHRVLKPGGVLIITVPDMEKVYAKWIKDDSLQSYWYYAIWGWQRWPGYFHYTGFTKSRMKKLLKNVGFSKVTVGDFPRRKTPSMEAVAVK